MSDVLERFALLAHLSEGQRRALSERLDWLVLTPGAHLFDEGDPADALLFLLEGRVRLVSQRRRTDGEIGPGSVLGALSLVVDGPREATAEACTPCRVLRLARGDYERLRASDPAATCRLLEAIVRESALFARDALAHLVDRSATSQ